MRLCDLVQFGPNATTFVTPVELFTTKYRSSLHGISAASGMSISSTHDRPDLQPALLTSFQQMVEGVSALKQM